MQNQLNRSRDRAGATGGHAGPIREEAMKRSRVMVLSSLHRSFSQKPKTLMHELGNLSTLRKEGRRGAIDCDRCSAGGEKGFHLLDPGQRGFGIWSVRIEFDDIGHVSGRTSEVAHFD